MQHPERFPISHLTASIYTNGARHLYKAVHTGKYTLLCNVQRDRISARFIPYLYYQRLHMTHVTRVTST